MKPRAHTYESDEQAIREAFHDWLSGRAYFSGGNYLMSVRKSRRVAPWNKTVKRVFRDVTEFDRAARAA